MLDPSQSPLADLGALRSIIDAVPHTIFIKDEAGRFVLVNQTMCALMGYSAEELIGKTDYDFVPKGASGRLSGQGQSRSPGGRGQRQ